MKTKRGFCLFPGQRPRLCEIAPPREREESNEKGRTQNTSNGEMNHYPDARNFQWILLTDWRMEEKLVPQWVFCLLGKPNKKRFPLVPGEI